MSSDDVRDALRDALLTGRPPLDALEPRTEHLRDRIAHAIRTQVTISAGPNARADLTARRSIRLSGSEADDAARAALSEVQAELDRLRERAEKAEALLRELVFDNDPCDYDHNGACQAHNLHDAPCPHARAKELLATQTSTDTTPAQHTKGANAEDCQACSGRRDLPYPFICPGTGPVTT
jgi:hypothetical protein